MLRSKNGENRQTSSVPQQAAQYAHTRQQRQCQVLAPKHRRQRSQHAGEQARHIPAQQTGQQAPFQPEVGSLIVAAPLAGSHAGRENAREPKRERQPLVKRAAFEHQHRLEPARAGKHAGDGRHDAQPDQQRNEELV